MTDADRVVPGTDVDHRLVVFCALDNGFTGPDQVGPYPVGSRLRAFLRLMPPPPFELPFLEDPPVFLGARVISIQAPRPRVWLATEFGAAFGTAGSRPGEVSRFGLHLRAPQAVPDPVPDGCFPFDLRIDRAREVYSDHRPTATAFEWVPGTERFVETGDFRPNHFLLAGGAWPPPVGRPAAAVLNVTVMAPDAEVVDGSVANESTLE